jgi:hypothetical protein
MESVLARLKISLGALVSGKRGDGLGPLASKRYVQLRQADEAPLHPSQIRDTDCEARYEFQHPAEVLATQFRD